MTFQPNAMTTAMFGTDCKFCPETGRPFEQGSGALSREAQTANFVRERQRADDMPKPGETCIQTGRAYEVGSGALPKSKQTANFLRELPAEEIARRQANAARLREIPAAGHA